MVLWELVSGGHPFQGIPQIALAQLTVFQHMRPTLPDDVPEDLKLLIERCWQPKVSARPRFEEILDELQAMKEKVEEESKAMYVPGVFLRNSSIRECSQDSNDGTKKSKIFGDRAKLTQARFSPKVQQREAATYDSSTDILSDKEESSMHLDKHVGGLILVLNDQSTAGL